MSVRRNDFIYLAAGIILSLLGVVAAVIPDANVGLYALAGLGGIILAGAIIIAPFLGANILIIAIFTNISDLMTDQGGPGVIKPLVLLVAGAIAIHYAQSRQAPGGRGRTARIEFFLLLYFMVVAASYLVAIDKDLAAGAIVDFAKDLVIVFCLQFALRDVHDWKQAAWLVMATTALICTLEVYQSITQNYDRTFFGLASVKQDQVFGTGLTPRLGGPINAPNMWGQVVVAVIPFVVYTIIYARRKILKAVGLAFLTVMVFVVFDTYSRGAYLALGLVFFLIMLDFRLNPMVFLGAVAVILVTFVALPAQYLARFDTLTSLNPASENGIYQDASIRGRSSEMLTGLEMFTEHPLLGLGVANYKANYLKYAQIIGIETRSEDREAHSLYVQFWPRPGRLAWWLFWD